MWGTDKEGKAVRRSALAALPDKVGREHAALAMEISMLEVQAKNPGSPSLGLRFESVAELLVEHFKTEEDLLDAAGAVSWKEHRREHDRLLAQLRSVRGSLAPWMDPVERAALIDAFAQSVSAHFRRESTALAAAAVAVDAAPSRLWA